MHWDARQIYNHRVLYKSGVIHCVSSSRELIRLKMQSHRNLRALKMSTLVHVFGVSVFFNPATSRY